MILFPSILAIEWPFYLKNSGVIEQMANCDTLVFDKTGTLTQTNSPLPIFVGNIQLSEFEKSYLIWVRLSPHTPHSDNFMALGLVLYE